MCLIVGFGTGCVGTFRFYHHSVTYVSKPPISRPVTFNCVPQDSGLDCNATIEYSIERITILISE
jgi:hypothetical protein